MNRQQAERERAGKVNAKSIWRIMSKQFDRALLSGCTVRAYLFAIETLAATAFITGTTTTTTQYEQRPREYSLCTEERDQTNL